MRDIIERRLEELVFVLDWAAQKVDLLILLILAESIGLLIVGIIAFVLLY